MYLTDTFVSLKPKRSGKVFLIKYCTFYQFEVDTFVSLSIKLTGQAFLLTMKHLTQF